MTVIDYHSTSVLYSAVSKFIKLDVIKIVNGNILSQF